VFITPTVPESLQERDERLLAQYKHTTGYNKEQKLNELLIAMGGPIGAAVNSFRSAPLPLPALEMEAKRQALSAMLDWDKSKGMSLSSYVLTMVKQRLYRYVSQYQNVARIPEGQILNIGPLREANADLTSRLGREPTTEELSDELGLPIKHIVRLRRNMRKDLLQSAGGLDTIDTYKTDENYEAAMMCYYSLTDQEKIVYDYSLPAHGLPRLKVGEIAKKLGVSIGRISQLKESIAKKIQPYLED
jgi:DNA-directed RNA polymerase specialized sigma subunit